MAVNNNELPKIIDGMYGKTIELLERYKFDYSEDCIKRYLTDWSCAKRYLLDLLSEHPNWSWDDLSVLGQYSLDHVLEDKESIKDLKSFVMTRQCTDVLHRHFVLKFLLWLGRRKSTDPLFCDADVTAVNRILENCNYKFPVKAGQKISRFIKALCIEEPFIKDSRSFEKFFARVSDYLNRKPEIYTTSLSINPLDYLLMSETSSWSSCHKLGKFSSRGAFCAGTLSCMLDSSCMVFSYLKQSEEEISIYLRNKAMRSLVYYNGSLLLQCKTYPKSLNKQVPLLRASRNYLQSILNACHPVPSKWKVVTGKSVMRKLVSRHYSSCCYPDHEIRGGIYTLSNRQAAGVQTLYIGAVAPCLVCGDRLNYSNYNLVCGCTPYVQCHNCCVPMRKRDSIFHPSIKQNKNGYLCRDCFESELVGCSCHGCGSSTPLTLKWDGNTNHTYCQNCLEDVEKSMQQEMEEVLV